ncbi:MAG TPA: VWA domain-containing protein [Pyrinomonadaceae bacterium]|nr:VWA domain-containing protein [Pyrinomonadaceae bacterium]
MKPGTWGKQLGPALLFAALALFSARVMGQTIQDLPPPPPAPSPQPKPTPPPPKDEDFEVIRVSSNLVVIPVSVIDTAGQPVKGLQAADFRVEEEGRVQEIAQIGDPDEVPLKIALLIDVSGSTNTRFDFEKAAAARFLKQVLKPADRATIFLVDRAPVLRQTNASAEAASHGLLSLQPATDKGPTAYFDTVVEAAQYLSEKTPPRHRRVLLVISDGVDNFSERIKKTIGATRQEQDSVSSDVKQRLNVRVLGEVQREVQRADAVFYSINPSGNTMHLNVITKRGQDGMRQLAEATGGTAFVPEHETDLDSAFIQIAGELRGQYLLQYYSNSQNTGTQFRRISVAVPSRAGVRVRARQGYYPRQAK